MNRVSMWAGGAESREEASAEVIVGESSEEANAEVFLAAVQFLVTFLNGRKLCRCGVAKCRSCG